MKTSSSLPLELLNRLLTVYSHTPSRVNASKELPLFATALKDFLLSSGTICDLEPGEVLFYQDDPGDSMYWVEAGVICILQGDLSNPRLLAFSHPGQVVGEVALIEGVDRTATVAAIKPTRLRRLGRQEFHAMLREKPETGLEIMRLLSARLRGIQPAEYSDGLYDHLTGTLSRQAFDSLLHEEIDRAHNYLYSLALVFIDLDFFKQVNDRYGHKRGDELLIAFSRRVMEQLRVSDLLFRYGGDEFVLILPGVDTATAPDLLERILDFVKSTPVPGEPPLFLSFSAGIAFYPVDGDNAEDVLRVADERLYLAKNSGRGRVTGQLSLR